MAKLSTTTIIEIRIRIMDKKRLYIEFTTLEQNGWNRWRNSGADLIVSLFSSTFHKKNNLSKTKRDQKQPDDQDDDHLPQIQVQIGTRNLTKCWTRDPIFGMENSSSLVYQRETQIA